MAYSTEKFHWAEGFPDANLRRAFSPGPGQVCRLLAVEMGVPLYPTSMTQPDLAEQLVGIQLLEADLKEAKRRLTHGMVDYMDQTVRNQGYDRIVKSLGRRIRVTARPKSEPEYDIDRLAAELEDLYDHEHLTRESIREVIGHRKVLVLKDRERLDELAAGGPEIKKGVMRARVPEADRNRNLRVELLPDED